MVFIEQAVIFFITGSIKLDNKIRKGTNIHEGITHMPLNRLLLFNGQKFIIAWKECRIAKCILTDIGLCLCVLFR